MGYRATTWALAGAPAVLLLVGLTQAAHLYLILGRRPRSVLDSPSGLAFAVHDWVVQVSFWLALVAPILWLGGVLLARSKLSRGTVVSQAAVLGTGYACLFAFIAFDPTGYVAWFLD